jgi:murein tripeptide amidase MpaA
MTRIRSLRCCVAGAALATFVVAAPAQAAEPRVLPERELTLSAGDAVKRDCVRDLADGRGVVTRTWSAPVSGFVSARLRGSEGSDWDLALFDRATGERLGGSAGFGSNEDVTTPVARGQDVTIQACRRSGSDASVPLTIRATEIEVEAPEHTRSLVEVDARTPFEFYRLRSLGLDLTDHTDGRGQDAILHSPADARKLTEAGFTYRVKIPDLAAQDAADRAEEQRFARLGRRAATPGGRTSYRTYADYQADLKKLVDENPGLVRPVTLPVKTIEGRDITGVEIATNVNRSDDGRPVYVQIGVHHAREWPAGEAAMEFGLDLVQRGKAGEARWRNVLDNARTVVIPIMNVDGFIASRTAGPQPNDSLPATPGTPQQIVGGAGYRRKNCRPLNQAEAATPCAARQQNDNGVDPNRNYGEQWGGPGTSSQQNSLVYHGTGPFSEPETQAVRQFLLGLQPTVLITNHTFTGLILRPPGTGDQGPAPDEDRMRALGDAMARETNYVSQYSYQLYDTTGTTDDWIYGGLASYSFTPEIGKTNFHPSYTSDFIPEYDGRPERDKDGNVTGRKLGGLREAFLLAGETAINPDSHSIISGTAPAGRTLRIKRSFVTVTSSRPNDNGVQNPVQRLNEERQSTLTVPANGQFTWHTSPSTRPFEKEPVPWTLTCEDASGRVLEQREVFVARAQEVRLDLACGTSTPATAPQAASQGRAPSAAAPAQECADRFAPRTTFTKRQVKLTRTGISVRGRSADQGCNEGARVRSAGLQRVQISISRTAPRGRCRFLRADGTFGRPVSCRQTSYLTTQGTSSWRYTKKLRLARGEYKIWVRALDRNLNIERKDARRNFLRIRVR